MTKKNLFRALCGHYDFIDAQAIVVTFGEDEFSGNHDDHWIVEVVKFLCDMVYTYDS